MTFDDLVKPYAHITQHVAQTIAPKLHAAFSIDAPSTYAVTKLMMLAHANDPTARARVEELAASPGMKEALTQVSLALREHPHFGLFQANAVEQAATHAISGRRIRHRPRGRSEVITRRQYVREVKMAGLGRTPMEVL